MPDFGEIKARAENIKSGFGERDKMYEAIEKIYLMDDSVMPTADWIKKTISPDARNKTIGAMRLLTATDPQWSVPRDTNSDDIDEGMASDIETACQMMWTASGRIRRRPVHIPAVLAGILYGQADITVNMTKKLLERANSNQKKRVELAAAKTPLMFEALSPKICYPVFDAFGLAAHYSVRDMKVIDIISRWGKIAEDQLSGKKATQEIAYSEYWDSEYHSVWVAGTTKPLLHEQHGLPVIPIASGVLEGDELFDNEFRRQPFLYTTYKSGLHERQSLMLTLMYSAAFTVGSNPLMIYKSNTPGKELNIDYSNPGGIITIDSNENIEAFMPKIMSNDMRELMDVADQKSAESTLYAQVLGEPLGGNAPFSMVSLLSQAGRLPLVPYQRMLSSVITDAMQIGFALLRDAGDTTVRVGGKTVGIDLDFKAIPEDIEIEATLDIKLPQDKAQMAKMAIELVNAKLMTRARASEDFLQIGQPDKEREAIWSEDMAEIVYAQKAQDYMQKAMMKAQAAQQGQMQGQPQGPMPPQMPPELMGQMQGQPPMPPGQMLEPQAAQEGLPMTEPVMPPGEQMGMPPELGGM